MNRQESICLVHSVRLFTDHVRSLHTVCLKNVILSKKKKKKLLEVVKVKDEYKV